MRQIYIRQFGPVSQMTMRPDDNSGTFYVAKCEESAVSSNCDPFGSLILSELLYIYIILILSTIYIYTYVYTLTIYNVIIVNYSNDDNTIILQQTFRASFPCTQYSWDSTILTNLKYLCELILIYVFGQCSFAVVTKTLKLLCPSATQY